METTAVIEYRKSINWTLRKLPIGKTIVIKNTDFKAAQVRCVASTLKKREGFEFTVSDAGRIDDVIVTRLK